MKTRRIPREDAGYTYITALILIFAAALAAQVTWIPTATEKARDNEEELIFRGSAYRDAVQSYWAWNTLNQFPPSLDALVSDPRQDGLRHLRRAYESPVCDGRWRILSAPGGGVAGVAPDCDMRPFRQTSFPNGLDDLDGSESYMNWEFRFEPPVN